MTHDQANSVRNFTKSNGGVIICDTPSSDQCTIAILNGQVTIIASRYSTPLPFFVTRNGDVEYLQTMGIGMIWIGVPEFDRN